MIRRLPILPLLLIRVVVLGDVTCPPVFSDHMVLQRDIPVSIWGTADPHEPVTVKLGEQTRNTTAGNDGKWRVTMDPLQASSIPTELNIVGSNTLLYRDVLVGEVWLCSGQSNMEKPIGEQPGQQPTENHETEIAEADHPMIRLFRIPKHGKSESPPAWAVCSPESVDSLKFSAAGYFFGCALQEAIDVPVGLIQSAYGGTMIEAWMPEEAFQKGPDLQPLLERKYFAWVDGVQATELYHSMIAPLCPYGLRGFLWYQGESNLMDGDSFNYTGKQMALVDSWRNRWELPQAPFYFVQLAPFNYSEWTKFPERQTPLSLPAFWEAQALAARQPHTGMVVTTDLAGNATDIHPTRKKEVGQRLANLALKETYGMADRIARSPENVDAYSDGPGKILLRFRHVGEGLMSRDGRALTHFQIAGETGSFHPATAVIIGPDSISVSSNKVENPVAVRFAWDEQANPNLVSSAGLPAVPFRTDHWPVQVIRFRDKAAVSDN